MATPALGGHPPKKQRRPINLVQRPPTVGENQKTRLASQRDCYGYTYGSKIVQYLAFCSYEVLKTIYKQKISVCKDLLKFVIKRCSKRGGHQLHTTDKF